jgi:intracellular sulfur oxidation DsrE/DsrF family protein
MPYRVMLIFVFSCWSMSLCADEPSLGPVIDGYGPTFAIENRDIALLDDFQYKVVFDVANYSDDVAALNAKLVSVARFLNMHARNGVPQGNMSLAVVLHGAALKNVLNNDAYEARYDVSNPNLELVMELHRAGVEFYVCGQSMAFGFVKKSELASPARVALSAMTMLTVLQADDYALLP